MDWTTFLNAILATSTPVLPSAALVKWAYPVCWAILLGWMALVLGERFRPRWHQAPVALFVVVILWTLVPGPWSPAYWLGLAFQIPSWSLLLLALAASVRLWRKSAPASEVPMPMLVLATGVGWLLLLDMLVLLPFAFYRWGFSVAALALAGIAAALLWRRGGAVGPGDRPWPWFWLYFVPLVLLLYVSTRLPSGNVFDALLDPWLWLLVQVVLVKRLRRVWVNRKRASATTHG